MSDPIAGSVGTAEINLYSAASFYWSQTKTTQKETGGGAPYSPSLRTLVLLPSGSLPDKYFCA